MADLPAINYAYYAGFIFLVLGISTRNSAYLGLGLMVLTIGYSLRRKTRDGTPPNQTPTRID